MKKIVLFSMIAATLFAACTNDRDVVRMTVASEKRLAVGVAPMEVLLVKEDGADTWSFFHSNIEGFDYEEGYEYVLMVRRTRLEGPVPADASSIRYTLVRVVSRTPKTSADMPGDVIADRYVWTAIVLGVSDAPENGVTRLELEVTALNTWTEEFGQGDIIFAELSGAPAIEPVENREYVFKAARLRRDSSSGIITMFGVSIQDLVI